MSKAAFNARRQYDAVPTARLHELTRRYRAILADGPATVQLPSYAAAQLADIVEVLRRRAERMRS